MEDNSPENFEHLFKQLNTVSTIIKNINKDVKVFSVLTDRQIDLLFLKGGFPDDYKIEFKLHLKKQRQDTLNLIEESLVKDEELDTVIKQLLENGDREMNELEMASMNLLAKVISLLLHSIHSLRMNIDTISTVVGIDDDEDDIEKLIRENK